jgi:ABC-2 type transport system permease protein
MIMIEFNPVLVKELRSRMRGARAFVVLSIYLIILSGVTLLLYAAIASNSSNDINAGRDIGRALFFTIGAVALTEVCVITPSLTAGSIAGERERQTYDLLVGSLLTPWQIVWGKLAAALSYALLLILAVVPLMSLAFLFGGVTLAEVVIALIGMITTAVLYACLGLFWSTVMRSTLAASSLAVGSVLLMLLGIPFLATVFTILIGTNVNSLFTSIPLVYIGGAFLVVHPFIALFLTEQLLSEERGLFYTFIDLPNGAQTLVPSPWIAFVVLALLISAALVFFSMRAVRPTDVADAPPSRRERAGQGQA